MKKWMYEFDHYVMNTLQREPLVITRGEGSRLWDADGREYLDFFMGRGTSNLGYCHPRVVAAIQEQAARLIHLGNDFYSLPQAQLAKALCGLAFDGHVFFSNSGTEANEAAIKIARRYARSRGREGGAIIALERGFHGRTFGALSATWSAKYKDGFEPMVPGFSHIPLNDIDAARKAIGPTAAAIILEVVQGEAGVFPASIEWLSEVRTLCTRHDVVLIFDEVQTGFGRTGHWFAYQHYGIEPDVITMAKSLGGGVPIGATLAKRKFSAAMTAGTHASTFGGAPLACAAALAAIGAIGDERMLAQAQRAADDLHGRLHAMRRHFCDVRALGLMFGLSLRRPVTRELVNYCRTEHGVLFAAVDPSILRLLPALTVSRAEIERAMAALAAGLRFLDPR